MGGSSMGQGSVVWSTCRSRAGLVLWTMVLLGGLAACSDYKKLSRGGGVMDTVVYDVMGEDRPPSEYYQLVRDSHNECDFCYRCGTDPFLVDKNVDAIQRLGHASFGRLEGQAEVVELFSEVLLEDCSALARASAAGSLTLIGTKLPAYPGPRVEDRGDAFLSYMQEIDRIYGWRKTAPPPPVKPGCAPPKKVRRVCPGASKQRVIYLLDAIGNLEILDPVTTRDSLKFFYGRAYLIDETDPGIRQASDTALVKRMRALISDSLRGAVEDEVDTVRADSIRGLKTLTDRGAVEGVLQRLSIEPSWIVRLEMAEYLGKVGTRDGVIALVGMLEDPNASVRQKARASLSRLAGKDFGQRPGTWKYWARQLDPDIDFGDEEPEDSGSGEEEGLPLP